MKRKYEPEVYLPSEMYSEILIHLDYKDIERMCLTNKTLYNICESMEFWKNKIEKDFPYLINPDEDMEYSMLNYGSMTASRDEADDILKDNFIIHLRGQPWFIEESDDILYSLKIIKDDEYIIRYKYITDDGDMYKEEIMTKNTLLKLLTSLVYYQHINFYGNLNF